jgi:hypothetical protein
MALLNYADALQEYLEEQVPGIWPSRRADKPAQSLAGHLVALDALGSVTSLLGAAAAGKALDAVEFRTVLTQAKAAFVESGLVREDTLLPDTSQPKGDATSLESSAWSLPEWCIEKLCRGMERLSSDIAVGRGDVNQG